MSQSADDVSRRFPSQAAMKAAMHVYVDRMNAGDAAGLTALFAPDARIEDPVGTEPKFGDAIATWFADAAAFDTRIDLVDPVRGSHADRAAMAFVVEFTPPGSPRMRIHSLDVCTFDALGRITKLEGYWGPDDIAAA